MSPAEATAFVHKQQQTWQPAASDDAPPWLDVYDTGESLIEHVAGIDDFEVAEATYRAAVTRWPAARITPDNPASNFHMF